MCYRIIKRYFSKFPDDVEEIYVNFISDYLPDLSQFYNLKILYCSNNNLMYLPPLPSTLEVLECYDNYLIYLPPLPSTLKELYCSNNLLKCLPLLPSTLELLWCFNNNLKYLPLLPSNLKTLCCANNPLICLPLLPSTLNSLVCNFNKLTYLPPLPSTLEILCCKYNELIVLPLLPSTLKTLKCSDNQFLDCYIKKDDNMSMDEYIIQLRNQINIVNKFRELFYALKYKKQFLDLLWIQIREPKIKNKYNPSNLITMLEGRDEITLDELDNLIDKW